MNYNSFELLKRIYFVRTSGSQEELKAANIIRQACETYGVAAHLEAFPVDGYKVNKAELKFLDPDIEVPFVAVGMSGCTPEGGITADFVYVTSIEDAKLNNIEGKICLIHNKLIDNKLYKQLIKSKPAALVLACGDVYLEADEVDLDPYKYRERHYSLGKIPAVCIRMKDAEQIMLKAPKKVHVEVQQDEFKVDSHNVVAEIRGEKYPDEIIAFSAHYDSVPYSRGAYDNGTGSTCIMEALGYFAEHKPARTLRFVWCGSEEEGLLGSKAYVEQHKDELEKHVLNINVDMVGVTLGSDIAVVSAEEALVNYIRYLSYQKGFPISVRSGVYSSDSTPFADKGVPALSFARMSPRGGASIHSRRDVIDHLSEDNYYRTCEFIEQFAESLINSFKFPVERTIPDNIKEELDYYNLRKERKGPGRPF